MSEIEQEVVEAASSSNETVEEPQKDEITEPEAKRRKLCKNENKASERLECRLGGILCCTVCLDLPKAAVYQCTNGHLMCAGCFTHVLADARLRDESATCPNCRVEISRDSASRNLAVENAISELPSECKFCSKEFSRNILERHQEAQCEERLHQICVGNDIIHKTSVYGLFRRAATLCLSFVNTFMKSKATNSSMLKHDTHFKRIVTCEYKCIGCPWRGPYHESGPHQMACTHPQKSASEVVTAAQAIERARCNTQKTLDNIFNLLSYEKITFNDLQFKPYRTEEYVNKLFYETSRFAAFNHVWVVKANINNSQRDPTQSSERDITYQVILKSKTTTPLSVQYVILRGPFGDMRTSARLYQFDFTERDTESMVSALPLPDTYECNRLLANKIIHFRLIMFLANK